MKRVEKINLLVECDVDVIHQELNNYGDSDWLKNILNDGWMGYATMSDKQLDFEYNSRTGE